MDGAFCELRVAARIAAPAERVRALVAWENGALFERSGFARAVVWEERCAVPGAERTLALADGSALRERFLASDAGGYRYALLDPCPLPVRGYVGAVRVTPCGDAACELEVSSRCEPLVPAAEWRAIYEGAQRALLAAVKAEAERAPQAAALEEDRA